MAGLWHLRFALRGGGRSDTERFGPQQMPQDRARVTAAADAMKRNGRSRYSFGNVVDRSAAPPNRCEDVQEQGKVVLASEEKEGYLHDVRRVFSG